jgi:hypothetical protein
MSLPAVRLLLRRLEARDAETGLMNFRVLASAFNGGPLAKETVADLLKRAGYEKDDARSAFKQLLKKAGGARRKRKQNGQGNR